MWIEKFLSWRKTNFTLLLKEAPSDKTVIFKPYSVEAIAYGTEDDSKRLEAILTKIADGDSEKLSGSLGYQFVEYLDRGEEISYMF